MAKVTTVAYHVELTRDEVYALIDKMTRVSGTILEDLYEQLQEAVGMS